MSCVFCALPRSKQIRWLGAWQAHCPMWTMHLIHLPSPGPSVSQVCCESTVPGMPCDSSGKLLSGYDTPGICELSGSQEDVVTNQQPAHSLVWDAVSAARLQQPLAFWLWLSYTYLSASREGGPYMAAGLLFFGIRSVLCSVSMPEITMWR